MTDSDRTRWLDHLGRQFDRAERIAASRESHGDDLILVGAVCRACGSLGGWGLYLTAVTRVVHCRECMAVQGDNDMATTIQVLSDESRCAGSSPAVAA